MSNPASSSDQHHHVDPAHSIEPPPLQGETSCCCHHLEGLHRTDGACGVAGCPCEWFVELCEFEENTRPDIVVEYDPAANEVA